MKDATRKNKRVLVSGQVRYLDFERFNPDRTVNLGPGGLFISTMKPLPVGTSFRFRFELPDLHLEIETSGTVTWVKPNQGMGIRFDEAHPEIQNLIELYIDVENEITSAFATLEDVEDESDRPRLFN